MKIPRLLKFAVAKRRGPIVVLWLLGILSMAFSLVLPSQVGQLTDLFGQQKHVAWAPVHRAILLLIGAQFALSILSYFRRKIEIRLSESMERSLTLDVFGRLLRFSSDFFREREVEKINARALEDTGQVAEFWMEMVVSVPLGLLSIVAFGSMMIVNNWFLGAIMIPLSFLSGYFVFFDRRIQDASRRSREGWDAIRVESSQVVANVSEIRSHGAFDFVLGGLNRSFGAYRQVIAEIAALYAMFRAINPIIGSIQKGALYWLGAGLCMTGSSLAAFAGKMTWGEVISFTLLAGLFEQPVSVLAESILKWRMTRESLRRLDEYLDKPLTFASVPGAPTLNTKDPEIGFDHVSVVAPSGARIVEDVDLNIPGGRHVAFSGPAGCGKSSLLNLLTRNLDRTSGRVTMAKRPVEDYDILSLAREVGSVPQVPAIFNTTLRNNILFGLRRPSEKFLTDAEGAVDITRFPDVTTIGDLDRRILQTVHGVGLAGDVLKKCLDAKPRADRLPPEFRQGIAGLRQAIAGKGRGSSNPLPVAALDRGDLMPGTVRENLLGPSQATDPDAPDSEASTLFDLLQGRDVLEDLVRFGQIRLLSEQALAARVLQRSPELGSFLQAHRQLSEEDAGKLFEALGRTSRTFDRGLRLAFFRVGIDSDIRVALPDAAAGKLKATLLEARERYHNTKPAWPGFWRTPSTGTDYFEGLSVRENLLGGRVTPGVHGAAELVDRAIELALEEAGLMSQALLIGLEFNAGEGGKFLSGGQRQKLAIARTLLKEPSVLLLDECTASLDQASQARILDLVRKQFSGKTVLSISHRLSTITDSDQIVVLDRGRIVQEGTYDELRVQEGVFRGLVQQEEGREAGSTLGPWPSVTPATELRRRLAMSPVFSHMKSDDLAFLESITKVVQVPQGEVLFKRGDGGTELYLILEGEVEFFLERSGHVEVVNAYGSGKVFGELALFGNGARTTGARARTPASLGVLRREDLLRLIAADPGIALALLAGLSRRMAEITDKQFGALAPGAA